MKPMLAGAAFALMFLAGCSQMHVGGGAAYALPFPPDSPRALIQGNEGRYGHSGHSAYSFDFRMPAGSNVLAARGGTVIAAEGRYHDGDHVPGHENFLFVRHADGTFGRYYHLTHQGPLVAVGAKVRRGQLIAHSGDTGASAGPHLHFDVTRGCPQYGCQTIFLTFTNAGSAALREGATYPVLRPGD